MISWVRNAAGAVVRSVADKLGDTLSVVDFGARLDGVTDDAPALKAAIAALPPRGGTIRVPDSQAGMLIGSTIVWEKRVRWVIGSIEIAGPPGDWIFINKANGGSIVGAGENSTVLKLSPPAAGQGVRHARATAVLRRGTVISIPMDAVGSGYKAPPRVMLTGGGGYGATAVAVMSRDGRSVSSLTVTSGGSSYTSAPAVAFSGGGAGAIKNEEGQYSAFSRLSIDLNQLPNATGILHHGGWYFKYSEIEVVRTSCAPSAIGVQIDSHTNRTRGSGSFGGAYVGKFASIISNIIFAVGHDNSTGTCTRFETIDVNGIVLNGVRNYLFDNPVVQDPSDSVFWNLTNVDGIVVTGGDFEGVGTLYQAQGSVAGFQVRGALTAAFKGERFRGPFGTGCYFDESNAAARAGALRFGSNGSAEDRYQNVGWAAQAGQGLTYEGRTYAAYMNLRPISDAMGNLLDEGLGGIATLMNDHGEFIVKHASAGKNPRRLVEVYRGDSRGLALPADKRLFIGDQPVLGPRQPAIGAPSGGATMDQEARAAIDAIRATLRNHGLTD